MSSRKYSILVIVGFVLWIAETVYFGWNKTPQSALESILDFTTSVMIFWGVVGDILSNVTVTKNYYPKNAYVSVDKRANVVFRDTSNPEEN